jgi:hypothetical protein
MIPVSFSWNSREKSICFKWNGFFSSGWEDGKFLIKILGIPIPHGIRRKRIRFPMRWIYLKGAFSFLTEWKLKEMEGTLSFPDPMINGILYGWTSAFGTGKGGRKIHMTINFLGENWCKGEVVMSPRTLLHHVRKWILPLLRETRGRRQRKGGE